MDETNLNKVIKPTGLQNGKVIRSVKQLEVRNANGLIKASEIMKIIRSINGRSYEANGLLKTTEPLST